MAENICEEIRLVGDGAMYWYLQEIIILPQFQRKGIGTMIVNHLVDYGLHIWIPFLHLYLIFYLISQIF